jgi:ribonuclease HI
MYTDGSVDPVTHRAGSGIVGYLDRRKVGTLAMRIPDGSSTLQAELHAIVRALEAAQAYAPPSLLIVTDSLGSLQAIKKADPPDNQLLLQAVHELLDHREAAGQESIFYWAPSHVGIIGNEAADTAAGQSLSLQETHYIPLSRGNQQSLIARHCKTAVPMILTPSLTKYLHRTKDTVQTFPEDATRALMTDLMYLRLGYKLYREVPFPRTAPAVPCPSCKEEYNYVHHFLQCTTHIPETHTLLAALEITDTEADQAMKEVVQRSANCPAPILDFLTRWPVPHFARDDPRDPADLADQQD